MSASQENRFPVVKCRVVQYVQESTIHYTTLQYTTVQCNHHIVSVILLGQIFPISQASKFSRTNERATAVAFGVALTRADWSYFAGFYSQLRK